MPRAVRIPGSARSGGGNEHGGEGSAFFFLACLGALHLRGVATTLNGLLDFCGHEPVPVLYKRLCHHYWDIDPGATAVYVNSYREMWDSDEKESGNKE